MAPQISGKLAFTFLLLSNSIAIGSEAQIPNPQILRMSRILCLTPSTSAAGSSGIAKPEILKLCPTCDLKVVEKILHAPDLKSFKREDSISLGKRSSWGKVELENQRNLDRTFAHDQCVASIANFKQKSKSLSFVAISHETALSPKDKASQRDQIKNQIENQNPKSIIVEGYSGPMPCEDLIRIYLSVPEQLMSETEYTVKLAIEKEINIVGGEPKEYGFSKNDDTGFQVLQYLSQYSQSGLSLREAFKSIPPHFKWTLDDFNKWYFVKNGESFNLKNALRDITPSFYLTNQKLIPKGTNQLADLSNLARDRSIALTVFDELNSLDRVMIVYGKDHLPAQLSVYENAFGKNKAPAAQCKIRGEASVRSQDTDSGTR
jgi:hypothetical protein